MAPINCLTDAKPMQPHGFMQYITSEEMVVSNGGANAATVTDVKAFTLTLNEGI